MNRNHTILAACVSVSLLMLPGCGGDALPPSVGKLDEGTHVTVVSTEGDFTLVERSDGTQGYVPSTLLVNTRESDENKVYAVTAPTELYESVPSDIPEPPKPRTPRNISRARDKLPILFMTESGREVYRPRTQSEPSFDPETKEILWFAMTCTNPDCPARDQGKDGRPFLFVWPDPDYVVGPNGPVAETPEGKVRGDTLREQTGFVSAQCPACMKIRNPKSETAKVRAQYDSWVRHYRLPEAAARAEQLNKEHKRRIEFDRSKRSQ